MNNAEWIDFVIKASDKALEAYKAKVQAFAAVNEIDFFEGLP